MATIVKIAMLTTIATIAIIAYDSNNSSTSYDSFDSYDNYNSYGSYDNYGNYDSYNGYNDYDSYDSYESCDSYDSNDSYDTDDSSTSNTTTTTAVTPAMAMTAIIATIATTVMTFMTAPIVIFQPVYFSSLSYLSFPVPGSTDTFYSPGSLTLRSHSPNPYIWLSHLLGLFFISCSIQIFASPNLPWYFFRIATSLGSLRNCVGYTFATDLSLYRQWLETLKLRFCSCTYRATASAMHS